MSSRLGHPAVLQHNDVVRAHNGLKPVGNDDDRLFRYQSGDRLLDQYLILRVEGCGCLVQQDDGRILQKRPCNRNALLLTAGECRAALSHDGLVAIGQSHDEVVAGRRFRRFHDLLHGGIRLSHTDVGLY